MATRILMITTATCLLANKYMPTKAFVWMLIRIWSSVNADLHDFVDSILACAIPYYLFPRSRTVFNFKLNGKSDKKRTDNLILEKCRNIIVTIVTLIWLTIHRRWGRRIVEDENTKIMSECITRIGSKNRWVRVLWWQIFLLRKWL